MPSPLQDLGLRAWDGHLLVRRSLAGPHPWPGMSPGESDHARRQRLIENRRCIECERKLSGGDRGALCSECYFGIITDPGLADPAPTALRAVDAGGDRRTAAQWQRVPSGQASADS